MKATSLAATALLIAQTLHGESVGRNPKSFALSQDGATLVMEGTWKLVTGRPTVEVPAINSFRVECSKQQNVCREYVAKLIQPSDDANGIVKSTNLFLMVQEFAVEYWDRKTIIAKAQPRAADLWLRISLTVRGAERESQETEARGALGARKTADRWVSR